MTNQVRLATITLFMRALLDELDDSDKDKKYIEAINTASQKYIDKTFTTKDSREVLATVANTSWDLACNIELDISIASVCVSLFTQKYRQDLEAIGLRHNYFALLDKNLCEGTSLKTRIASTKMAKKSIECINKAMYDNRDIINSLVV